MSVAHPRVERASSGVGYLDSCTSIFEATAALVEAAQHAIVLQMYLFASNGDQTLLLAREGAPDDARAIARLLIAKKQRHASMPIVVVLDTNTPADSRLTRRKGVLVRDDLERAGVVVLHANLFGTRFDPRRRLLPRMNFHLHHEGVPASEWATRQYRWQALQNVEDHRKNLVIDGGRAGLVTSHNFIDPAFDWHENGFLLEGAVANDLWSIATTSVRAALALPSSLDDDAKGALLTSLERVTRTNEQRAVAAMGAPTNHANHRAALVENEAIRARLFAIVDGAGPDDTLLVATTYFSDQPTFDALERAARRGVRVRLLVDSIAGLPLPALPSWLARNLVNHRVLRRAAALSEELPDSFEPRIHDSSSGRMMHLKTAVRLGSRPVVFGGQANYTPNSFSGAWLETNVESDDPSVVQAFTAHFDRLWTDPGSTAIAHRGTVAGRLRDHALVAILDLFATLGIVP